ncbi:hypothetical protein BJ878DRAFT_425924 [Calycina marina]|uniref:Uncharacterized protein n=1 Tax=Calycina marina TaxID=1763456 RepID=A0A9P7YZC6_9HELO|nr:hypothetical protein BJ878DRAFT_425924 [Calycina marina]
MAQSLLSLLPGVFTAVFTPAAPFCRYLPGDSVWPSAVIWSALNTSVGGRLIATVPLASPCHDPTYNAATCAYD